MGALKSVSMSQHRGFPSDWLGALGVLAVKIDLHPGFFHGASLMEAPCRLREDLAKGCRSARHEKHVIFFSIKGQALQVIRILHGAMDFNNHLTGEDLPG